MEYRYERQKLSAVFDIISGGTPKRSVSDYWGGDIPWISIQDFNDRSRFIDCTEEFISEEGFKNSSTNILEKRDIIISARGTVGKVNIIGSPMAFNQSCYGLRVRDNIYYLFAYYSLINSIRELKVRSYGSVFSTITKRTFDEVEINVFNFCDQLRVSALLGSLDSKIELNNKIITNLEAQAQAIFKSWFVDFEPFQDGEFVESELGLIPEGWMVSTTGREFDIEYGKNLPTKHLLEKGYPVFGGNGQIGFFKEYLYEKPRILVSCRGAASGKVGFSKPYSYVTNNSLVFNEKKGEYFYYFKYLFNGIQFENYVTGSAQPQLTIANSKDIKILIPNKETVIRFNIIVGPYFTTQLTLSEQSTTLAQIRDTLLPKLMSGEIDVSNIKIEPEEIGHV
ncbi:MAG: restriction endonuclease subunit S [Saccharofermentanales bacterium]|jgi:type I restriction enzyme S subunit